MLEGNVLTAVLAVLSAIAGWFVETIPTLTGIFWSGGALTFVGTLATIGVGIACIMLVMSILRRFLSFR